MPLAHGSLTPGHVSAARPVPASIPRPQYVGRPSPEPFSGREVKDEATIAAMRVAGGVAAGALAAAGAAVAPGVTTEELDRVAHEYLVAAGAYPSSLGYRGFPKSVCTSVNEVICHGIPDDRPLRDGDVVNVDVTAYVHGVHGDTSATFLVGQVEPKTAALVEHTREAMLRGIKVVRAGRPINVIGRVIESYARRFGHGVVRDYTGHGVGTAFHSGLIVPHYDAAPAYNTLIEPGMTFTIEPMLTLGTAQGDVWPDDWTVVTRDRLPSAQFEHTVLVTESGSEILTLPPG